MIRTTLLAIIGASVLACCGCKDRATIAEETAILTAWAEFKNASLSGLGEVAANRVTLATHKYYDEIRRLALHADRKQLDAVGFAQRYTVLGIRLRVPKEQLRSMSGRELLIYCVDQGWIGKNNATDEGIGSIVITGDHARAVGTKAGRSTDQYLHFVKEGGIWKLDMMQLMKVMNVVMDEMLVKSGMTEDAFLKKYLEAITGRTFTKDVWVPLEPEAMPEK